jgi:hypothetical protein
VISQARIFRFWWPLAGTWLMMAIEGPLIAAFIARLGEAESNLAAYGIAYALGLIIEAPIIMILSAATALVKDKRTYLRLRNFTYALNGGITLFMLILLYPPIFDFLTMQVMDIAHSLSQRTYHATMLLLPWPAAIGFRRFFQGILIKHGQTKKVAYGTLIRLASILSALLIGRYVFEISGANLGAIALSFAVVNEALASRLMAAKSLQSVKSRVNDNENLTYRKIFLFYWPLAMTSIVSLAIQPVVTFFIAHGRMPIASLAVFPVINSFVFLFRSVGLSFQEVAIAILGESNSNAIALNTFFYRLGGLLLLVMAGINFSPLLGVWFESASGLSAELSQLSLLPTRIMTALPLLSLLLSYQRALLIHAGQSSLVSNATFIEVSAIAAFLYLGIDQLSWIGIEAAAIAFMAGRLAANGYLTPRCFRLSRISFYAKT